MQYTTHFRRMQNALCPFIHKLSGQFLISAPDSESKSSQSRLMAIYILNATSLIKMMLLAHFFVLPSLPRHTKMKNDVGAEAVVLQPTHSLQKYCPDETENHINGNQRKWRVCEVGIKSKASAPYVEMRPAFLAGTWANSTPWYITPLISMLTTNDEFSPLASPETQCSKPV